MFIGILIVLIYSHILIAINNSRSPLYTILIHNIAIFHSNISFSPSAEFNLGSWRWLNPRNSARDLPKFLGDQRLFQFFVVSVISKRATYTYVCACMLRACACERAFSAYIPPHRRTEGKLEVCPSHDLFPSPPFHHLVPLGKYWRRKVAPTDLTIDKDASSDLLSPRRRVRKWARHTTNTSIKTSVAGRNCSWLREICPENILRVYTPFSPTHERVNADNWRSDSHARANDLADVQER